MGVKDFLLKQVLKSKLKGMPEAQQEMILGMVEKHPDFFKKIGDEIEKRKKSGETETEAAMHVMRANQSEFQKIMMQ